MSPEGQGAFQNLASELRQKIRGGVFFDDGSRALYATDASNYRQVPIGVITPSSEQDVRDAVNLAAQYGVPLLARGAGTSLAGQCCNVALVMDFSKSLNRILEINPSARTARVEPGVVLDELRQSAGRFGLTFGPDPATHSRCTLGGMIGNNACGVHSVMAGKTADNVEELRVLTYDGLELKAGKTAEEEIQTFIRQGGRKGEIYQKLRDLRDRYAPLIRSRYPALNRRVSGYNLDELLPEKGFNLARALVGSEGTCVTVLEAKLRLIENPPFRALCVLGYPDIYTAGDAVAGIMESKPIGLEGLDEFFVRNMRKHGLHLQEIGMLPEGAGWLLVEFGASSQAEADEKARELAESLKTQKPAPAARLFLEPVQQKRMWSLRESSFGATVFVPGERDTYSGFEDSAVPPAKLGAYMRELRKLYDRYDYYAVTYGHFGDGCIHTRISFDLRTYHGIQKYRAFIEEASELVIRFGGSLSGEHGDGQTWGEFLHKMYGPELVQAFREFKAVWDPQNKMNPGKVVNAYRVDENLRLQKYETIPDKPLHFNYSEEQGSFARVTERCIGIGKCVQKDADFMCPSFMATGEERHSTRGRAHLLHEMMRGEVVQGGWQDEHVKKALDLCLACKGCKVECPVNVDMATYKAEFLAHYYEKKPRPLSAYAFGLIGWWSQAASLAPGAANFLLKAPGLSQAAKKILGMSPERNLPLFAKQNFRDWMKGRRPLRPQGPEVLLWPDTFNNFFFPNTAQSAVEVLEAMGYRVLIPDAFLCCGRPLYDYGMLGLAKKFLEKILQKLEPVLSRGVPLVGLEPSCVAVFRDELRGLLGKDPRAARLSSQAFFFDEFLEKNAEKLPLRKLGRKAVVQGHCHEKALSGMGSYEKLLSRAGLDFEMPEPGCCGMAGAFGFEKQGAALSRIIAERKLMPALKKSGPESLVIADGFSCRKQAEDLCGVKPMHLAEVIRQAL